jgi:hypothetical protein
MNEVVPSSFTREATWLFQSPKIEHDLTGVAHHGEVPEICVCVMTCERRDGRRRGRNDETLTIRRSYQAIGRNACGRADRLR